MNNRNSNLELYRIITMVLIVAHHYIVNSGLTDIIQQQPFSNNSVFSYLFGMWGKTGINCFLLITGYFMCQSQITLRKFLKLFIEVEFYSIIIYFAFLLSGYTSFSFSGLIKAFIPVRSISDGFVSCFLVFYLCIPFLNILVRNLQKREHLQLIALCLFIYTFLGSIPGYVVVMNYVSWFCVLYFIASYIRKYGLFASVNNRQWGQLTLLSIFLSIASVLSLLYLSKVLNVYISPYYFVSDCNAILAVVTSVCSFMYFKDLNLKYNPLINSIGACTFGVLLIHAHNSTMRVWLWRDIFCATEHYSLSMFFLYALLSVVVVFVACIVIDYIRVRCIEYPVFCYIDKMLSRYKH